MGIPQEMREIGAGPWELPADWRPGMRVPVRVFGSEKLVREMDDQVFEQAARVAMLPGHRRSELLHAGRPLGLRLSDRRRRRDGSAPRRDLAGRNRLRHQLRHAPAAHATSPGPRCSRTSAQLVDRLAVRVPAGVGSTGFVRLARVASSTEVLLRGARWAVEHGFGSEEDLDHTEAGGLLRRRRPVCVSERARERGRRQLGTLGSGNHYLEIQVLRPEGIFDDELARALRPRSPRAGGRDVPLREPRPRPPDRDGPPA